MEELGLAQGGCPEGKMQEFVCFVVFLYGFSIANVLPSDTARFSGGLVVRGCWTRGDARPPGVACWGREKEKGTKKIKKE